MKKKRRKISEIIFAFIFAIAIISIISFGFLTLFRDNEFIKSKLSNLFSQTKKEEISEELISDEVSNLPEESISESKDISEKVKDNKSNEDLADDDKDIGEIEETEEVSIEEKGALEEEANKVTIKVYFPDMNMEYLIPEERIIPSLNILTSAIEEIFKGPSSENLYRIIPQNVKLLNLKVSQGIAKINLNSAFIEGRQASSIEDIFVIYSIVNTLTEFRDINAVEFYVDGERLNIYGGLDISSPLYRRSDLIK